MGFYFILRCNVLFESPTDASFTDTLYIGVVIKGYVELITDNEEKAEVLNQLMQKYQIEGHISFALMNDID